MCEEGWRNSELKALGTPLSLTATRLRLLPAVQTQKAPKMGKDSEGKVQESPQKCFKTWTFSSPGTKTQKLGGVWHNPCHRRHHGRKGGEVKGKKSRVPKDYGKVTPKSSSRNQWLGLDSSKLVLFS